MLRYRQTDQSPVGDVSERPLHRPSQGSHSQVLEPDAQAGRPIKAGFEVMEKRTGRSLNYQSLGVTWRGLTFDRTTSPLGLLLLHDPLALLSPPLVDGVARVVDLEGVLVVHGGVLDFPGLLVKLQNVSHPEAGGKTQ